MGYGKKSNFILLASIIVLAVAFPASGQQTSTAPADGGSVVQGPVDLTVKGRQETERVSGTVSHFKDFKLSGLNRTDRFAKLLTADGRLMRVDLGPVKEVQKLNIEEGDRLVVWGHQGLVNDKPAFIALGVETEQGDQMVPRDVDPGLRKMQGRVLKTRTVDFERNDAPGQLLARIQIERGPTTVMHLGSVDRLPPGLDLEGKEIRMLARPARIGGKRALVAEEIYVDGRTIPIDYPLVGGP